MKIWSYPGIYPSPETGEPTAGIFIHKQNLALKANGAEVNVIQTRDWFPVWPFYNLFPDWKRAKQSARPFSRKLDGISVYHPTVFSPKPSRLFNTPHGDLKIKAIVKFLQTQNVKKGKDVIMAQWLIPDGYHAVKVAKELGISVAVEMQGDDIQVWPFQSEIHRAQALWVLENADLILGCSDFLGKEAQKLYSKPLEVHTIYTGIDLQKFKPLATKKEKDEQRTKWGLKETDIVILNVGSSIARKGWNELFEAVSVLKSTYPTLKIVAATGGLSEFTLAELAVKYGIENQLIDLGSVSNIELPSLYQACDIFCLPSYWEGLANVLCEAMSSGCAIVTTAVSGHPEVVIPAKNGELVTPRNVNELINALEKLISSPELRQSYGIEARRMAEEKIKSHEDNAAKLYQLLKTII